jgi:pyruvate dehydrogenase E2 component (dihydrolipoamide acetyltransferase)
MPTEILMPALSPTMEEGTLAKWLVKEGDTVSAGDLLAEIETDKATMEFEAVDEGVIGKILVAEGTEGVKVNTPSPCCWATAKAPTTSAAPHQAAPRPRRRGPPPEASRPGARRRRPPRPLPPPPRDADGARVFASPLARRIAKDKGLDLARSRAPARMAAS